MSRPLSLVANGCRPGFVFLEAILRTDELLPDQACLESILIAFFDRVNDVLEVPGRPGNFGQFELEEAEPNLILRAVQFVKHHDENHAIGRSTVVEGLGEPGIIVAPGVQVPVVVGVVLLVGRRETSVGAALVPVSMAFWCIRLDPLLILLRSLDALEVERHVLDIVHVVGEEEDGVAPFAEQNLVMRGTAEVHVDVMRRGDGVLERAGHCPRGVLLVSHKLGRFPIRQRDQGERALPWREGVVRVHVARGDVFKVQPGVCPGVGRVEGMELWGILQVE